VKFHSTIQKSILLFVLCISLAGCGTTAKTNAKPLTYDEFKVLEPAQKKQVFSEMSGPEIYALVKESDENWPVTAYDGISPENAKETIVLYDSNGVLHFNLAWPCYGGFLPESIASIGELSGFVDVSRDGGDGGCSMSSGKNPDGTYPNDSQRGVPKSSAKVRTGIFDVDAYKKVIDIVTNGQSEEERLSMLEELGYAKDIAGRFISDQEAWLRRDEISGKNSIADGAKKAARNVESKYGYYGIASPWKAGNLNLSGMAGQINTVFTWGTLCASGLISNLGTAEIH